jgi:hypothetical protein
MSSSERPNLTLIKGGKSPEGPQEESRRDPDEDDVKAAYGYLCDNQICIDQKYYPLLAENPGLRFRIEEIRAGLMAALAWSGISEIKARMNLRASDPDALVREVQRFIKEICTDTRVAISVQKDSIESPSDHAHILAAIVERMRMLAGSDEEGEVPVRIREGEGRKRVSLETQASPKLHPHKPEHRGREPQKAERLKGRTKGATKTTKEFLETYFRQKNFKIIDTVFENED